MPIDMALFKGSSLAHRPFPVLKSVATLSAIIVAHLSCVNSVQMSEYLYNVWVRIWSKKPDNEHVTNMLDVREDDEGD